MTQQQFVSRWAQETFGDAGSNIRVASRANEEMAELLRALASDDDHPNADEEMADVLIVLYRLADRMGVDLEAAVCNKMAVNRRRVWERDASGCVFHLRHKEAAAP